MARARRGDGTIARPAQAEHALFDAAAITAAIARGDREAFALLYRAKFDLVAGAARRASGLDESACLDIAQETFMRVIRKMKTIESDAALDAWLRLTTKRVAYDRLRAERRRAQREREARASEFSGSGVVPGAPDEAARLERLAWLRAQLGALDRASADALDLRLRTGMTLAQVGGLLGLKPGAVDGRISRAVGAMRAGAKERGDE